VIEAEVKRRVDLAERISDEARQLRMVGLGNHVSPFELAAAACREQAMLLQRRTSGPTTDPYVVDRQSMRLGDDWQRGFIITMLGLHKSIFGRQMPGLVAILANVAFDRSDLTVHRVRSKLRRPPGVKVDRRGC
jgi:hypothetical protein